MGADFLLPLLFSSTTYANYSIRPFTGIANLCHLSQSTCYLSLSSASPSFLHKKQHSLFKALLLFIKLLFI